MDLSPGRNIRTKPGSAYYEAGYVEGVVLWPSRRIPENVMVQFFGYTGNLSHKRRHLLHGMFVLEPSEIAESWPGDEW